MYFANGMLAPSTAVIARQAGTLDETAARDGVAFTAPKQFVGLIGIFGVELVQTLFFCHRFAALM